MIHKPHGRDLRNGRFSEPNRIYLVTSVTYQRSPVFADFACGRYVVSAMQREQSQATTLAFVIMPDHLHWLMQLSETGELDKVVGDIKSISAHRINKQLRRRGKVWQAGYHDHALRAEEDVQAVARYVVANPLRAKLVERIGEYPLWDAVWL